MRWGLTLTRAASVSHGCAGDKRRHGDYLKAKAKPDRRCLPLVLRATGLGRSTIYRMITKKQFPRPCGIGDRALARRQIDIDAWIDRRSTAP
ncbi:AlpA family phage regulatory protein [Paucibacter sp. PLA-PC-4]|uniref:AlpA family phage regulatory protein n=1 Tax=Paucibacter sp. PLA-PC-4 TaxID=2993655 RepID=UPI003A4C7933